MMRATTLPRLVCIRRVMSGRLCIEGTPVLASTLADYLVHGASM